MSSNLLADNSSARVHVWVADEVVVEEDLAHLQEKKKSSALLAEKVSDRHWPLKLCVEKPVAQRAMSGTTKFVLEEDSKSVGQDTNMR